ncbi:tRNA (adenosine(37)-N6)-threonylcarbamoyltransferase complex dimerization subunit type 1 TsaB [Jiella avicenniae]|uniref:N(6)-L-threonylcarbamoyladenine synthase n=1 Tax=Jiella avicenniae TaxID=2907202 RepID=A0A9X1T655_9HYPH|nr:tRNA (adenosine(37)-N6)-threonylcarbamoyltransferase complex dimerization subunit type 1 TsaB [Jiella avicenniae]MCE7030266.1 tRNA (adenosine(37)-N6)-threonylcarbamoyltransferase complex dimerization subunit type 1 TsaB [Jiella avicenniae]
MPPLILALDTAFARCTAAVFDPSGEGRLLASAEPEIGTGHAERLTGVVDAVLAEAGAGYRDLSRIVVTTGPGSFTGIRVGVAAARGLSLALDIPAVGVSTLQALAGGAVTNEDGGAKAVPVLAVVDARRGEVYAALFSGGGAMLSGPAALQPSGLAAFLAGAAEGQPVAPRGAGGPLRLVGSGSAIAEATLSGVATTIVADTDRIDPEILARLGAGAQTGEPPRPLYLRGADAKPSSAPSLRGERTESIP